MEAVAQAWIAVLGGLAVWLVGSSGPWRRWGYVLGLASQPAWIWTAVRHEQWGILALAVWYTLGWARGLRNYWKQEKRSQNPATGKIGEHSAQR